MSKRTKIWLITAACLVALGLILFAAVMSVYHWDFTKLSTEKYETNTFNISDAFSGISINANTADIVFARAEDAQCKVVCYAEENEHYSVAVEKDTLTIQLIDGKEWYEPVGINFNTPNITVYLPESEYALLFIKEKTGDIEIPKDFNLVNADISLTTGDVEFSASASAAVKIKTTTGDIQVKDIAAGTLELSVSTGDVVVSGVAGEGDIKIDVDTGKTTLTNTKCKNLISNGTTGDISLKNVIASGKFSIERSTGDVTFDGSDAKEILVKTETGDVGGSLLTDKVFLAQSDTGSITVPKTLTGGSCEITTHTGNIQIDIQ